MKETSLSATSRVAALSPRPANVTCTRHLDGSANCFKGLKDLRQSLFPGALSFEMLRKCICAECDGAGCQHLCGGTHLLRQL